MAKLIHAMIRVFDLDRAIDFYDRAFGLKVERRVDFDAFTLVYLRNDENDFELELTQNRDRSAPYNHGDGYGHIAVCVDDLEGEHGRLSEMGCAPRNIVAMEHEGALMARFFFVQDPDGYKIEVLQRHGPYR